MANNNELLDLLIINNDLVLDEKGLPQLIGGRSVVAQDIKHRILDSGYVYRLIGERGQNVIRQILKRLELIIEEDLRVIAGTVKATYLAHSEIAELSISCVSDVGDVLIALPVIPEELQNPDETGGLVIPEVLFYLPKALGEASQDVNDIEVISLGDTKQLIEQSVELGSAELVVNENELIIFEMG